MNGSSTANGDQKKYNLGDYVWEDTNKDGKQVPMKKGLKVFMSFLKIVTVKNCDSYDNR